MTNRMRRRRGFSETRDQGIIRQQEARQAFDQDQDALHVGKVIRFVHGKYGFVLFRGHQLFFHHSQVANDGTLHERATVSFRIGKDPYHQGQYIAKQVMEVATTP